MKDLNLPSYSFRIIAENKKTKIFDALRGGYFVLSPEEWVRQNFLQFLIQEKGFPAGRIAVECSLKVHQKKLRADAVVYDTNGKAIVLIECKAPEIEISQAAFNQIAKYNLNFKLPYLLITNGLKHFCAKVDVSSKEIHFLKELPSYEELSA